MSEPEIDKLLNRLLKDVVRTLGIDNEEQRGYLYEILLSAYNAGATAADDLHARDVVRQRLSIDGVRILVEVRRNPQ